MVRSSSDGSARSGGSRHDRVAELAEALDGEGDDVAGLEVAARASRPSIWSRQPVSDRPAADDVAGSQVDVRRRPRQHLAEAEVGVRPARRGRSRCR